MWLPENVKLQLKEGVEKSSKFYSEWINLTYYLNISMLFGWSQDIYYYPLVDLALWKESLNSGGHQLIQQYQQNEQSPLILTALTDHKKDPDITFEIQVQA